MTPTILLLLFVITLLIAAWLFLPADHRPAIPPDSSSAAGVADPAREHSEIQ